MTAKASPKIIIVLALAVLTGYGFLVGAKRDNNDETNLLPVGSSSIAKSYTGRDSAVAHKENSCDDIGLAGGRWLSYKVERFGLEFCYPDSLVPFPVSDGSGASLYLQGKLERYQEGGPGPVKIAVEGLPTGWTLQKLLHGDVPSPESELVARRIGEYYYYVVPTSYGEDVTFGKTYYSDIGNQNIIVVYAFDLNEISEDIIEEVLRSLTIH